MRPLPTGYSVPQHMQASSSRARQSQYGNGNRMRNGYGPRHQGQHNRRNMYAHQYGMQQKPHQGYYGQGPSTSIGGAAGSTVGGAFFLGNIDKALSREEVYDFIRQHTCCYISKFDMPNVTGNEQDPQGRPIRCAGFAFVHVKNQWMADEMLAMGTIKIGALQAEIKPYDQAKRMISERRHRESQTRQREADADYASTSYQADDEKPAEGEEGERAPSRIDCVVQSEIEDWAIEDDPDQSWRHSSSPVTDWNVKLGKYCSLHEESAYQTEDESISHTSHTQSRPLDQNTVNISQVESSHPNSRVHTPSYTILANEEHHLPRTSTLNSRSRPSPLRTIVLNPESSLPVNISSDTNMANAVLFGNATQELLDEDVTPTTERINSIVSKKFSSSESTRAAKKESSDGTVREMSPGASSPRSAVHLAAAQVEQQIQHMQPTRLIAETAAVHIAANAVGMVGTPVQVPHVMLGPDLMAPDGSPLIRTPFQPHPLRPISEELIDERHTIPQSIPPHQFTYPLVNNPYMPYGTSTVPNPAITAQPLFTSSSTYQALCMSASQILHQNPHLATHYRIMFNAWTEYYRVNREQAMADSRLTEVQQLERLRHQLSSLSNSTN